MLDPWKPRYRVGEVLTLDATVKLAVDIGRDRLESREPYLGNNFAKPMHEHNPLDRLQVRSGVWVPLSALQRLSIVIAIGFVTSDDSRHEDVEFSFLHGDRRRIVRVTSMEKLENLIV